jgi:hypothetical protein
MGSIRLGIKICKAEYLEEEHLKKNPKSGIFDL